MQTVRRRPLNALKELGLKGKMREAGRASKESKHRRLEPEAEDDEDEDDVEDEEAAEEDESILENPLLKRFGDAGYQLGDEILPYHNVYCSVPGRTSLLSSTTKYKVTVGEIQRRISPPECLNASLLGGILRKAKAKDGGKTLRDSLRRIGLALPAGRRKQAIVTAWTALVEEEAVHMAKDFQLVCEKEFRAREFGIYLTKIGLAREGGAGKRREALEATKRIIDELAELVASDRTPLTAPLPISPRSMPFVDPAIQHHLAHFTLVTHGFGSLAVRAVLGCVGRMVDESLHFLDRAFPPNHGYQIMYR
ncbi:unnamed protein product, partial [Mesorhabditis spiculigera]